IKKNGIYRVKTSLREMIVYATQNLASDPPFSRLDLISCRNLLIYMDSALQKKIIPLFHYTLNPDGYLFLGSSESIGNFSSLFSVLDSKSKIFKVKKDSGKMRTMEFAGTEVTSGSDLGRMEEKLGKENAAGAMEKLIVSEYAPAAILIDHKYDILYLRGPTNKFLEFTGGQASLNLLRLANPGIAHKLPSALREAQSSRVPVTIPNVQVRQNGQIRTIDINIRPLSDKGEDPDLLVVVFVEVLSPRSVGPRKRKTPHSEETHPRVVELENELQATKKDLEATIEELEAANEELKSSNEELQSINEETQSTNEELATAREELQSTNEELVTVNSELQSKVEELSEINDDISNLFASTDIGTVFLDNNLRIKRFTPAMKRLFNLIPADMGRSLRDIAPKVYLGSILDDAERVLETLQMSEKEIETARKWFLTRILPYRTRDDLIAGVVITFVDVTEIKRFEREMAKAKIYAESIVNTIREPLLILDGDLRVVSANRSFYRFFVSSAVETVGKLIYDLGNGQWNIPELRRLLEEILPENSTFDGFEVEHEFPVIGYRKMLLNARRMQLESDGPGLILLVLEGSTESARVCRQAPGLSEEDIGR
ncbi:MAG: PAS domain-containing protein, partial [Syntrophobacteraceae bacterium]